MTKRTDMGVLETLVQDHSNRERLSSSRTMDTIRFREARRGAARPDSLPRVDHLVTLGARLGAGGIGEVVSARQASLERSIAVKRPRKPDDRELSRLLLREARVIGFIEHPNIPPVHFVGSTESGDLIVGLKQIEGETLTARLDRERPGEGLSDNLDLLLQVCNAVGYAHSLGIVHLDIKPDNIMTGHYGEVYVLDWGLAVAWRDDVEEIIPRQPMDDRLRGTPAFLAPEMITNEPATPATDVYLLGGVLHYMLTHEPPNSGQTGLDALRAAYDPPERVYPDSVPAALADICRRALSLARTDRFRDADELRDQLVAFRRHQRELEAHDVATRQVDALLVAVEAGGDAALVYRQYGAARQAIDELSRADPDVASSAPMLQGALERMIEWELGRDNVGSAELLLAELPKPNQNLIDRCAEQRSRLEAERSELLLLRQEFDTSIGRWTKAGVTFAIAVTLGLSEWVPFFAGIPTTARRVLVGYLVYIALLGVLTFVMRRMLFATRSNRGLIGSIWLLSGYAVTLRIGCVFDVISLAALHGYDLMLVTVVATFAAFNFDGRVFAVVPFYGLAAALCFLLPEHAALVFGTGHFVALTVLAISLGFQNENADPSSAD